MIIPKLILSLPLWYAAALHLQCRLNRFSSQVMYQPIPQLQESYPQQQLVIDASQIDAMIAAGRLRPRFVEIPADILRLLLGTPPFYETINRLTHRKGAEFVCFDLKPKPSDELMFTAFEHDHRASQFYGIYTGAIYVNDNERTAKMGIRVTDDRRRVRRRTAQNDTSNIRQTFLPDSEMIPVIKTMPNINVIGLQFMNNVTEAAASKGWLDIIPLAKQLYEEDIKRYQHLPFSETGICSCKTITLKSTEQLSVSVWKVRWD